VQGLAGTEKEKENCGAFLLFHVGRRIASLLDYPPSLLMIDFEKNCVMKAAFCALKLRRLLFNICATSIVVL
jgi:hypothetical protein